MRSNSAVTCLLPREQHSFGRYTLLCRFAAGGMANLYLALLSGPDGFNKIVAIKIMHSHLCGQAEFVKMFIDEARLASRIAHPNIVQILELGRIGRSYFIAMEYVEGESVLALLRRSRPSFKHCARIIADAAAGLHAAHELCDSTGQSLEVVHRDLSPDNVLISYSGTVKIADFGVARARDSLHTSATGSLMGKFSYMAPEQAAAQSIDRRVDIFALGIVLYEMTTQRRLFRRSNDAETLQAVLRSQVPSPSRQVADYPRELERVVCRALQRNPDQRYQTAQQLQEDLERFLIGHGEPVLSSSVGQLMTDTFSDRIADKRRQLASFVEDQGGEVPLLELDDDASAAFPAVSGAQPRRWSSRVSGTLALLLMVTGLVVLPGSWGQSPVAALQESALQQSGSQQSASQQSASQQSVPHKVVRQGGAARRIPQTTSLASSSASVRERPITPVRALRLRPRRRAPSKPPAPQVPFVLVTEPPTEVYLGDRNLGQTPISTRVSRGRHTLILANEQLRLRVERRVTVGRSGLKSRWAFGKGTIRFRVPPGRHVALNGKIIGLTPLSPLTVWEGQHVVAVTNPYRYQRQQFSVTVRPARTTWVAQGF